MNFRNLAKKIIYQSQKNPVSKFIYDTEVLKRSKLKLTDIFELAKPMSIFSPTFEMHQPNEWYGHAKIFKKFLGLPDSYVFKFTIEHGMHLTDDMLGLEKDSDLPSVLTYSKFREKAILPNGKKAFSVGPFIHYAPFSLSKTELLKEKRRLGKTLLVFPSHSSADFSLDYDVHEFIKKVKKIGKGFDTVRICIYWKDVLRGHALHYKDFECVTAGHIMDPMFLPRLKSIIETSTMGVSSVVGNHVGYSVFMNKPHLIIPQKHTVSGRKSEKKLIEDSWWKAKSYVEVMQAFSKYTIKLTSHQKKVINYYWGSSLTKTKKEFLDIIEKTEKIYN